MEEVHGDMGVSTRLAGKGKRKTAPITLKRPLTPALSHPRKGEGGEEAPPCRVGLSRETASARGGKNRICAHKAEWGRQRF